MPSYASSEERTLNQKLGEQPSVLDFGARGDYTYISSASIASGTSSLTTSGMSFASSDIGKTIVIRGAGAGGTDAYGTITAVASGNSLTVSFTAGATVSGAAGYYATDDAAAFQAAIDAIKTGPGGVGLVVPSAGYLIGTALKVYTGIKIVGASSWLSRGTGSWSGASLIQAPGSNIDIFRSGHDPNFGGDDNWLHATVLQDLFLYGDRGTNKRGSGCNLYRPGENFELRRVSAYSFPRHGVRVYDYGAPQIVDKISVHQNGSWIVSTASGSTFTSTAHGLLDGELVKIKSTGAVPSPLKAYHDYYVVNSATNTFQLAATSGGAAITLTNTGSGTITVLAGAGLSFEGGLNTCNRIGTVSGDNCAKALIEVIGLYGNSLYIQAIKSERTNVGLAPEPGNSVVLSAFNLNNGTICIESLNAYTTEASGYALIQQANDSDSGYGRIHVLGNCTVNPVANQSNYPYGYVNLYEAISISLSDWLGKPQHPEMDFYFADRVLRSMRIRSEYSAIELGHTSGNPNVVSLNAVNFGDATQGGFISVNSRYAGFPNWSKTSSAVSDAAMFMRLGASKWEIRFGDAANADGADPGESAVEVTPTRTKVSGLLWSDTDVDPLHVGNDLGDFRVRYSHGGEFYRYWILQYSSNEGSAWNTAYQINLSTGALELLSSLKLATDPSLPLKVNGNSVVVAEKISLTAGADVNVAGLTDGSLVKRSGTALGSVTLTGTGVLKVTNGALSGVGKVYLDDEDDVTSSMNQGSVVIVAPGGHLDDISNESLSGQLAAWMAADLLLENALVDGLATVYGSSLSLASTAQVTGLDAIISSFDSRISALEGASHTH